MPRSPHSLLKSMATAAVAALAASSCANMGRLEGGPRDENPPVFLRSNPAPGATNVDRTRFTLVFDENIQLEDAFTKVVVSPPQKQPPQVSANGRRLSVELRDSLLDSTTYTIDFADAIKDLNEGNVLDGFALDFSTGSTIDTLRISGIVLQAENLEPAQGMLVGVYSNLEDSAVSTLPMERIARTNQLGQFTVRNLPPGEYRVFAVNDLNRDYHWDRSEDVAFFPGVVSPSVERITVTDTLFAADRSDSLVMRDGVRYLPNDIFLSWFNVGYSPAYLSDYKRPERRRITINFAAEVDSMPQVSIVDGAPGAGRPAAEWALQRLSAGNDSLELWIADPEVLAADSLRLGVRYLKTDSTEQLVWTTDTLRFFFRDQKISKKDLEKAEKRELERIARARENGNFTVDSLTGDTVWPPRPDMEYFNLRLPGSKQDVNRPLLLASDTPWESLDSAGLHLDIKADTLWKPVAASLRPDSSNLLTNRRIDLAWEPGATYRLTVDTLAARSIYGTWNRPFCQEFTVASLEDYSNLSFTLPGTDSVQVVVELLNTSDEPVARTVKPVGSEVAVFRFLQPGQYYARLFVDANANGKWDTGSIESWTLPEDVYYFAKKLNLKKNWDVEQTWLLNELPVDLQKPYAIKKNRPKLKRGEQAPQEDEEESWEDRRDEMIDPFTPRRNHGSGSRPGGLRPSNVGNTPSRR